MATFFAVLKFAGAEGAWRARIAGTFRAFKRTMDEDILRRHDEAMLRSLDKRILDDAGIVDVETMSKTCQKDLGVLRTLFSWTRFAK